MTLPIEGCVDQNHKEKQEKELAIITIVPPLEERTIKCLKTIQLKKSMMLWKNHIEKKIWNHTGLACNVNVSEWLPPQGLVEAQISSSECAFVLSGVYSIVKSWVAYLLHKPLISFHYSSAFITSPHFFGCVKCSKARQKVLFDIGQWKISFVQFMVAIIAKPQ